VLEPVAIEEAIFSIVMHGVSAEADEKDAFRGTRRLDPVAVIVTSVKSSAWLPEPHPDCSEP
jgi:hypothetical protein